MSSDDTIYVQVTKDLKIAAQWGTASQDQPPDPEKARPDEIFDTLVEFYEGTEKLASECEYGYTYLLTPDEFRKVAARGPAKGPCPTGCCCREETGA